MKKKIFYVLLTLISLGVCIFFFIKYIFIGAFILSGIILGLYWTCLTYLGIYLKEKKSIKNPLVLKQLIRTNSEAMFRVSKIKGKVIALTPWGHIEEGVDDLKSNSDYCYLTEIPEKLREVNQLFLVKSTPNGLIFNKIIFIGEPTSKHDL